MLHMSFYVAAASSAIASASSGYVRIMPTRDYVWRLLGALGAVNMHFRTATIKGAAILAAARPLSWQH
jgi:hypothetical protein